MPDQVTVLLAAGGAAWEAPALRLLNDGARLVLKRCVDLTDLLASAGTGEADVAVVSGELSGLALLAGSACTRFGVFEAGQQSARDPKYTVVPQRERLEARARQSVSESQ